MSVYNNLWRCKSDSIHSEKYGIANENFRKLFSKDNSRPNNGESLVFSIHRTKENIQLGWLLKDHCLYGPFNININKNLLFIMNLPAAVIIVFAWSGQTVGTYTANSLKLVLRKKILVSRIIFLKSSKIISSLLQDNYLGKIS